MFYEGTLQNGVTEGERMMEQVSKFPHLGCRSGTTTALGYQGLAGLHLVKLIIDGLADLHAVHLETQRRSCWHFHAVKLEIQ